MIAEHRVRASDGWRLSVLDLEPAGPAAGLVIAGHAMMVDRRTLYRRDRPSLAGALVDAGLRVLVPDLRGHGRSGPRADEGADWSYDQLVEDIAAYLDLARTLAPDLPLATLGHSLFGHAVLAFLTLPRASDRPALSAHVALCSDVWLASTEDRPLVQALKTAIVRLSTGLADILGFLPARRAGVGSADEACTYFRDVCRGTYTGTWTAGDGHDFRAGLPAVDVPTLLVLSQRDRLADPRTALRLWSDLPRLTVWRLGHPPTADAATRPDSDFTALEPALAGLAPTHMGAVTDPRSAPLWRAIAAWLLGHLRP